jgi:carbon storage regulator
MLVLSRKPGERIYIGDHIVLTVVAIQGNRVRLGIDAPTSVEIQREELLCRQPPGRPRPDSLLEARR